MTIQSQRYLRKPLYVDAVRITSANFDEIAAWCQGEIQRDEESGSGKRYIKVRVHNPKNPRQTKAFVGDWLLYTERGYKVYTSKAFHSAFDIVEGQEAPVSIRDAADAARETTPQGEEIEYVPATPEAIAEAILENDEKRADLDLPPQAEGKRILTLEEQNGLTADEIREMVQAGEVVLIQDTQGE